MLERPATGYVLEFQVLTSVRFVRADAAAALACTCTSAYRLKFRMTHPWPLKEHSKYFPTFFLLRFVHLSSATLPVSTIFERRFRLLTSSCPNAPLLPSPYASVDSLPAGAVCLDSGSRGANRGDRCRISVVTYTLRKSPEFVRNDSTGGRQCYLRVRGGDNE
jgi:hypothetical protein